MPRLVVDGTSQYLERTKSVALRRPRWARHEQRSLEPEGGDVPITISPLMGRRRLIPPLMPGDIESSNAAIDDDVRYSRKPITMTVAHCKNSYVWLC